MQSMLEEHKPMLLETGMPPAQLDFVIAKFHDGFNGDWLEWFEEFIDSCTEAQRIYNLPLANWAQYRIFNITGLREQKLLKEAGIPVRKSWNKRPKALKKVNDAKEQVQQD